MLLRQADHFTLSGRLAATHGSAGFSAGVHWQQQGSRAQLVLTGPLGFGAVRVGQSGERLTITAANGVRLEGAAAAQQLVMMLGFQPPLRSLRYWIVGVPDPATGAEPSLDAQQRLAQLRQGGWRIEYDEYVPVRQQWLPRRLTLARDDLRLKLVINVWQP